MSGYGPDTAPRRRAKRPVVSDLDGTREGGLVFCMASIGGIVLAAVLLPGALTIFWVWFAVLLASAGLAWSLQKWLAARAGLSDEDCAGVTLAQSGDAE